MGMTDLDRIKTKLIVFFSALGLAGFFLNLLAGIGVWSHGQAKAGAIPTYDQYANVMRTM
jgi:hypothetical protein